MKFWGMIFVVCDTDADADARSRYGFYWGFMRGCVQWERWVCVGEGIWISRVLYAGQGVV